MTEARQSTVFPWALAIGSSLSVGLYDVLGLGRGSADTRTDEIVVLLGFFGVILGLVWLAIIERRNGSRQWGYFLRKALLLCILLCILMFLAVLSNLGVLR